VRRRGAQLTQALQEAARMQQETAFKAMETQKDISVAYARREGPAVVVTPGIGPAIVPTGRVGDLSTGEVQVCPRCKVKSPIGSKFCANCGERFYE